MTGIVLIMGFSTLRRGDFWGGTGGRRNEREDEEQNRLKKLKKKKTCLAGNQSRPIL